MALKIRIKLEEQFILKIKLFLYFSFAAAYELEECFRLYKFMYVYIKNIYVMLLLSLCFYKIREKIKSQKILHLFTFFYLTLLYLILSLPFLIISHIFFVNYCI